MCPKLLHNHSRLRKLIKRDTNGREKNELYTDLMEDVCILPV